MGTRNAALAAFVVFCIGMTIPVWGQLNKSQDDAETIEEAIDRKIAEHNAEPTSHTADGEAIDVHRKNGIIDHPAGSVVGDKTPFSEYKIYDGAITKEKWSAEDGNALEIAGHEIWASLFNQGYFQGVFGFRHEAGANYPDSDLIYQFSLTLNGFQSSNGYYKLAFTNDLPDDATVLQFEKTGTNHIFKIKEGGVVQQSIVLSSAVNTRTFYRLYYEQVSGKIILYQGATIVTEYTPTNWKDFVFNYMVLEMYRTSNTSIDFRLRDWKSVFSFDVS